MRHDWENYAEYKEYGDLFSRYAEEFLGCDKSGCLGEFCSHHQYREKHAGRFPAHHLEFIQKEVDDAWEEGFRDARRRAFAIGVLCTYAGVMLGSLLL